MKNDSSSTFDIIVAGGGAAGLSFVHQLLHSPWRDKKILLIDREPKETDDRTWCFWEKEEGPYESIVHHRWQHLSIKHPNGDHPIDIAPYSYKMIRSKDFYRKVQKDIDAAGQITRFFGNIDHIKNEGDQAAVTANGLTWRAPWCVSSVRIPPPNLTTATTLDQHFRGWFIRTQRDIFDPSKAVLMDFRVPQGGTRFMYVLPTSSCEALVEFTIFSKDHLAMPAYDAGIAAYLLKHYRDIGRFETERTEYGIIPMTDYKFKPRDGRVIYIGTAGGDTRPSSGYTFLFIQRRIQRVLKKWLSSGDPGRYACAYVGRHNWYDQVLLRVLSEGYLPGDRVFYQLFEKNDPQKVLAFLNRESNLLTEIQIINSLPKKAFLKAAFIK